MLNKLLKYEFQATGRLFLPAYGVLIVLAAIQRVMLELDIYSSHNVSVNILAMIIPAVFIAAVVAVCVISLVAMIDRFYKNLLGREGYLMFTLPVSAAQLIWSKIIVAVVWSILSLIAGILAFLIVFAQPQYINSFFNEFSIVISEINGIHGIGMGNIISYCVEIFILSICSIVTFVLMTYLCMSIGQLAEKHRGLCAFGAFIGINIVLNNVLAAIFSGIFSHIDLGGIQNLINSLTYASQIHISLLSGILVMIVQAAIYFLFTRYILTNKLNLE